MKYEEHTIDEVLPGNPALLKNPVRTKKQDQFFDNIEKYPFSISVKKCIHQSKVNKLLARVRRKLNAIGG